ncbi:MAG: T9SS type A sorting domain-containing protein [Ignavibacteria bacterium]|nr:T9SS type A sorting domain-containing protein [Ignavibacteria bacterium]
MRTHILLFVVLVSVQVLSAQKDCTRPPLGRLPVSDMTNSTWNGIRGGLYPNGRNDPPPDKIWEYRSMIDAIVPLSNNGTSDPSTGKIVVIGVGASNPRTEFNAFIAKATSDPLANKHLVLANTCVGGQGVQKMNQPSDSYWKNAAKVLDSLGCSAQQVQVAWVETDNTQDADTTFPGVAQGLADQLYTLCATMRSFYPNLKVIYFSSRSYAGYIDPAAALAGKGLLSPRDHLNGWAIKFLIERQITGTAGYEFNGEAAALPALMWCTDNWADGLTPKLDGLFWHCDDFSGDGLHLSPLGEEKSGARIHSFFSTDELAQGWYHGTSTTSVNEPPSIDQPLSSIIVGSTLTFESSIAANAAIYTIHGELVWSEIVDGSVQIPTNRFPSGLYLVRIGERTFTFLRP